MTLRPVDRRGLGEIVAWMGGLVCLTTLLIVGAATTGKYDPLLLGSFLGAMTALFARGTQGAAERSARSEILLSDEERSKLALAMFNYQRAHEKEQQP